jgi:uncharacterized DUF497 family protein
MLPAVEVEWDGRKSDANRRKHGIGFEEAASILYDPRSITIDDDRFAERRFVTVGRDAKGRLLAVVSTWRGSRIRLISARFASSRERRDYGRRR